MNTIGQYIKQIRTRAGLSQEELATLLGHRDSTLVNKIEGNKALLPLKAHSVLIDQLRANEAKLYRYYLIQCKRKYEERTK